MAVNKIFGVKVNQFFIILSGIVILISAFLIYYFILRSIYGRFDVDDVIPNQTVIEDFLFGKSPEVAILGVSRGANEPVWNGFGVFEPRLMLPLSLSYDHRIIDGADAIRFLRFVVEALEQPLRLL